MVIVLNPIPKLVYFSFEVDQIAGVVDSEICDGSTFFSGGLRIYASNHIAALHSSRCDDSVDCKLNGCIDHDDPLPSRMIPTDQEFATGQYEQRNIVYDDSVIEFRYVVHEALGLDRNGGVHNFVEGLKLGLVREDDRSNRGAVERPVFPYDLRTPTINHCFEH